MTQIENSNQIVLFDNANQSDSYSSIFKKLYFYLYSNSEASRAERIVEDLFKILLCKLAEDRYDIGQALALFNNDHKKSANDVLLPLLRDLFPSIITQDDKFSIGDAAIKAGLEILSNINLKSAPAHIIGDAFQALIGPRLRGDRGQFFTPRSVVKAMVEVADPQIDDTIIDPACGTGGFLVEAQIYRRKIHGENSQRDFGGLIGIDKDADMCRMSRAMLELIAPNAYTILNNNSLDIRSLKHQESTSSILNADIILTNPPFGTKIGITESSILKQYELGYQWTFSSSQNQWFKSTHLRKTQDPQILFIELCLKLLRPGGLLGIVLPEGIFGNRTAGYIWDFLREQGNIYAMIDCPRTTFQPGTDIKTNILFFKKSQSVKSKKENELDVSIAVAVNCGHDRRGRDTTSNGEPYPDDFKEIGKAFKDQEKSQYWSKCKITDKYYIVPRYYDASLDKMLQKEAKELQGDLLTIDEMIQKKFIEMRKGHEVGAEAYGTGNIPFVRTSDINNWEISSDPTKSISESIYDKYAPQQKLKPGDILFVADGRYRIGRTAILPSESPKCVIQSHLKIITVSDLAPFDAYQLLYLLNLPVVLYQIRNLTFIQSTLGNIGKRIGQLRIPVPEITPKWKKKTAKFKELIEGRARLLADLQKFKNFELEL